LPLDPYKINKNLPKILPTLLDLPLLNQLSPASIKLEGDLSPWQDSGATILLLPALTMCFH
jgi:hypothetical protein